MYESLLFYCMIDQLVRKWEDNGFSVKIFDSPKDAVSFDKMVIVYSDVGSIRLVYFYCSKTDKICGQF